MCISSLYTDPKLYSPYILFTRLANVCQVAEALEDSGMRERAPVGVLKRRLMNLQADVAAAHERLHTTEVGLYLGVIQPCRAHSLDCAMPHQAMLD